MKNRFLTSFLLYRKWLAPGRKKSQTKLEKPPIFDEIEKRVFMGTLGTRHVSTSNTFVYIYTVLKFY
jgi:hypothetical protein